MSIEIKDWAFGVQTYEKVPDPTSIYKKSGVSSCAKRIFLEIFPFPLSFFQCSN
jgi:hypothetical protein